MKGLEQIIAEHPFFYDMPAEFRSMVADCGKMEVYQAGQFLFKIGQHADYFFLLRSGKVALELNVPGGELFRFQTSGEGDIVGWSWLFEPYTYQFDARAIETTRVVCFNGMCLRAKCDENPTLGLNVMRRFARVLISRLAESRMQLIDVYGKHKG